MRNKDIQIENFLLKWNEMIEASKEIEGFKWNFEVSIR